MSEWGEHILRCWELADNSDCKKMKFGAVLIYNEEIVGEGFNHVAHPSLSHLCNPCIREGVQSGTQAELCTAVHAEQAAMIDAHRNGYSDLSLCTLYVAGKFPDGKRLIKSKRGLYCTLCSRIFSEERIGRIVVPTKQGEAVLSIEETLRTSFEFAQGLKKISYKKDS